MKSANALKKLGVGMAVAVFWLAVWFLAARLVDKELLLPYPHTVLIKLGKLCITLAFWKNVALSLARILLGILAALIIGTALAILTCRFSLIYRLVYPLITVIRATPVASFIILVLIWLGSGKLPVFICFLMVLPIIWAAVSDGIRALDPKLAAVCKAYGFSFGKRLKYFYIPSILPYFLSACKTSIGMAWKAGVAAEVLAVTPASIGKQLYNSKLYLETSELFAWTAVIIILSLAIEKITRRVIGRLGKRRTHADG
mgnify:CR=1 FL=1